MADPNIYFSSGVRWLRQVKVPTPQMGQPSVARVTFLNGQSIAAQKVMEFPDLVAEQHLTERGVWLDWQTADGEQFKGLGVFPLFGDHPGQVWRPMPDQGYDTSDILARIGYSPAEIAQLLELGVVKQSV